VFFNIALNKSEGVHAATRTLVELNSIEVLGKLAEVPYWRCLSIEQTNPEVMTEAQSWFDAMSEAERVTFTQRALESEGFYAAPINGLLDHSTKAAISRYQAENGLIANGRIDFQLYQSLINRDLSLGERPAPVEPATVQAQAPTALEISISTPRGQSPVYGIDDALEMSLSASQDAYVYCYYRDDADQISRIFPNRFQPDPYIVAGSTVPVLNKETPFSIQFVAAGNREEILCIASRGERGLRLSNALKTADLTPIPIGSLEEIVVSFEEAGRSELAEARLPISVVVN
jgi:peptidoglycan hydrolase-like protein with peptidoglycan-binding domain